MQQTNAPLTHDQGRIAQLEAELAALRARVAELEAAAADPEASGSLAYARLRALLQHSPDHIFVKDAEGRFREVSDSLLRARGLSRDEFVGRREDDIYPEAIARRFREQDAEVRAGGEPRMYEESFDYDGRTVTYSAHKFLLEFGEIAGIATDITDRKAQELDTRRIADRLRLAVEGTGIGSYELNLATGRGVWSPSAFVLLGLEPPEDLVGTYQMWRSTVHPDDLEEVERAHAAAAERGGPWQLLHRIVTPRGAERWLVAYGQFTEREGEMVSTGIALDVTEQRELEAALRANSARLQLAMDAGQMAVWEHVTGQEQIAGSPELFRLFGMPDDGRLTVADARDNTEPEDWGRILGSAFAARARGERYFESEFRYRRADGEQRWFLVRGEMEMVDGGIPTRTIGVVLDITTRKLAEQTLGAREMELRAALQAGALAVSDFDHIAGTFQPSPQLNYFYGYPPDFALTIADVRLRYHPAHVEAIRAESRRDAADPTRMTYRWEMRLLLPGGGERWVEGIGEYIREDETGRILRSRGVVMDVTERVVMQRHQQLLMAELNHRVKNTLAIVQGLAHQTFRAQGLAEEASRTFEGRLEALSRAHNLLTRENWDSADVRDLVEGALLTHGGLTGRCTIAGPRLRLQPKPAVTLALALHELATNATKYGALSDPEGCIDVSWRVTAEADPRLILRWAERGGPPVSRPERTGFGTRMIERALATELRATAHMEFAPTGLICTIDAPLPPLAPDIGG